ncbi:MAG TPA: hypothetical protein VJP79_00545 [Nitrososphaera sp.]|nr:hypothetical protein [Nitrososphaera sp.]
MSDIALPIWIMLSWLIRQVDSGGLELDDEEENEGGGDGGDNGGEEGADASQATAEFEPYQPIEQMIKIGIAAFSILLAGLSIYAYKRTAIKGIVYAAVAFGLFAVQMLFDYMEDAVEGFETAYNDIVFLGMTLAILVLFFLAIVWRKSMIKPG